MDHSHELTEIDVKRAADRIRGHIRTVSLAPADSAMIDGPASVWMALEFMQHTGSFKARGAVNFLAAHLEDAAVPAMGVAIASGGNAGLACAWACQRRGVPATVFLPEKTPRVKVDRLARYGASVRMVGSTYADAAAACDEFAVSVGALKSHAFDHPDIAAGAGTLMAEILERLPTVDTVVVAVGGGGLFAGIATAAAHYGIRVVGVEPQNSRAFNAALAAGSPEPVQVDSIAADSLGARTTTLMALNAAARSDSRSVLVPDTAIVSARGLLWDQHRLAVEPGAATALAAIVTGAYRPEPGEVVCIVLCGANADPADLAALPDGRCR